MDATIVPIALGDRPARRLTIAPTEVKDLTFAQMAVQETDLEEFIRKNIDIVFPDETLLVVGQQVVNEGRGRADLVALDAASSVVLIELKRDPDDMRLRAEQLEWQAIRYAANYALIDSRSARRSAAAGVTACESVRRRDLGEIWRERALRNLLRASASQ